MNRLILTFLGTGTSHGIPMIRSTSPACLSTDAKDKRLRSSVSVSWGSSRYVVDCGPDFRQQMLRENIQSINGILFTHEHADHTAGLDDIRAYSFQIGAVPLYATKHVFANLRQRFEYIFKKEQRYPGAPKVAEHELVGNAFLLDNVTVTPISVLHGSVVVTCYRFNNLAYLTDVKTISAVEKKKLEGLDVLIVNALRLAEHPTHFNLEEALALIAELQPKKAYLTHISHRLGVHAVVQASLPANVYLAYDGLQVSSS